MPSINDFLGAFKGGTRVNRFRVSSGNSVPVLGNDVHAIHIRATSFPDMAITPVPIQFRGKTVQLPSTRAFTPWSITVMDDSPISLSLHKKFMDWSDSIIDIDEMLGVGNFQKATGNATTSHPTWTVEQLENQASSAPGAQGPATSTVNVLKSFKLANCWPIQVGPLQLDMSQDNMFSMFNVTMAYSHFES